MYNVEKKTLTLIYKLYAKDVTWHVEKVVVENSSIPEKKKIQSSFRVQLVNQLEADIAAALNASFSYVSVVFSRRERDNFFTIIKCKEFCDSTSIVQSSSKKGSQCLSMPSNLSQVFSQQIHCASIEILIEFFFVHMNSCFIATRSFLGGSSNRAAVLGYCMEDKMTFKCLWIFGRTAIRFRNHLEWFNCNVSNWNRIKQNKTKATAKWNDKVSHVICSSDRRCILQWH